jgi:predicted nucleotide-binding protein
MADDKTPKNRNFPFHELKDALRVPQTIRDVNAGRPMNRLLLADALKIKPSSSNFRNLLSSSLKYGLTSGTEKATEISLTNVGEQATSADTSVRATAFRRAAATPQVFNSFLTDYNHAKVPATEMLAKVLTNNYQVPQSLAVECAGLIVANGEYVGVIRAISGSNHVLLDSAAEATTQEATALGEDEQAQLGADDSDGSGDIREANDDAILQPPTPLTPPVQRNKPIFVGHGKNRGPLAELVKILNQFKIPHMVATAEPNLGRPIPVKVRETILECGSAILIFTRDEKFTNGNGDEIWRPSENVVHELGAASFQYEERVVIFKEKGIDLPTNFSSVGYIEFEEGGIGSKAVELLSELVGFGLVKITAA